jgi:aspartate/methionine/tyrosine aminotransferase
MFPIAAQICAIQFPPISKVKGWLAGHEFSSERPLVDLCQAVPAYPPAAELTAYLQKVVAEPETARYAPDEGLPEVREAVAKALSGTYAGEVIPEQVCLTIGASQAFWLAMLCLCRPDDEAIVPLPAYFDHPMGLAAMGVRPVWAAFDESRRGLPDPERIAKLITPRTRAILLVSPSNPTGAVTPPELFDQLLQLARAHDIALVADETYNAFLPGDGPPHRLFQERDWAEHFIHIASFGKTYALTGFRAGALVGHPELIHQALKIQDSMAVCQPRITQLAVAYGCRQLDGWVATQKASLLRRHDRFVAEFDIPDNPFRLVASGGFFAWVRHPWAGLDGRRACRRLVDEANLICLPGEAFGPGQAGYLRLAFGNLAEADIDVAVERFCQLAG